MNKKTKFIFLSSLAFFLFGCADTNDLYDAGLYYTSSFVGNVYTKWDDSLKGVTESSRKTLSNDASKVGQRYFNGSGVFDSPFKCYGFDQAKSWYPSYFMHEKKELYWAVNAQGKEGGPNGMDILNTEINKYADNSSLYGVVYSQTKKLTLYSEAFKKGILSKLYNGQIKCNAWSYLSMILLDQRGYGTMFPKQMVSGSYFSFVARGGSDNGNGRIVDFSFDISFYKLSSSGITKDVFHLDNVLLQCNQSSELTSLVGFDFKEVGYDPKGMIGMSIEPKLNNDPVSGNLDDFTRFPEENCHTGTCILEVLFPDSSWN